MLIGAFLMIVFQVISLESAFRSINLEVIGFLFGMFSIVTALDKSGVLRLVAIKMLSKASSLDSLLMIFIVGLLHDFLHPNPKATLKQLCFAYTVHILLYRGFHLYPIFLSLNKGLVSVFFFLICTKEAVIQ